MTPESARYLEKAADCLKNARAELAINLNNDAGRNSYLAALHAAQALIFERTGRVAKTHGGVHREFARLAKSESGLDKQLPIFLTAAYNLKSVADYETGPGSIVPPERATSAAEEAQAFVDAIANVLAPDNS